MHWLRLAVALALVGSAAPFAAKKNLPKKKAKKAAAPAGKGFGAAPSSAKPGGDLSCFDTALQAALRDRCAKLQKAPTVGQTWLELGAILTKAYEYGEAELVFRAGAALCPGHEMLSAAALTLGGDSEAYCRDTARPPAPPSAFGDEDFSAFAAPPSEMAAADQADRAVDWRGSAAASAARGVVFRSKGPLLKPSDCAWVIEEVEKQAAHTGWTTDRHVQAPTTDIPVSQVGAIREWFDIQLHGVLFPMLAARYPEQIGSPAELRVMDAFVVRYDAREQASLPTHQDENTFSFTIALNDRSEYEGGGTGFSSIRPVSNAAESYGAEVLNADAGGVVTFPGKLKHGGNVVTAGRRYIIPLFIYSAANKSKRPAGYLLKQLGIDVPEGAAASLSRYAAAVAS